MDTTAKAAAATALAILLTLAALPLALAQPMAPTAPAIEDLPRNALIRLRNDDREQLARRIGSRPDDFDQTAIWLTEKPEAFNRLRTRVVVIHSWSTSNATSRRWLEDLAERSLPTTDGTTALAPEHPDLHVIGIHEPTELRRAERYLDRRPIPFKLVIEQPPEDAPRGAWGPVAEALGLNDTNRNVVIDKSGIIRYVGLTPDGLARVLPALLAEPFDPEGSEAPLASDLAKRAQEAEQAERDLRRALRQADWLAAEQGLETLWLGNPEEALKVSRQLIGLRDPAAKTLGAAMVAKHADSDATVQTAAQLNAVRDREAQRLLIRSLGTKPGEDATDLLRSMARSPHDELQVSAMHAVADLGDPELIVHYAQRPAEPPCRQIDWPDREAERLRLGHYGLLESIIDDPILERSRAQEVLAWLRSDQAPNPEHSQDDDRGDTPANAEPPFPLVMSYDNRIFESRNHQYHITRRLLITDRTAGPGVRGVLPDPRLANRLDTNIETIREHAAPIFGLTHLPVIRLDLVDKAGLSAEVGASEFAGVAKGNSIFINAADTAPNALADVLRHEYVHIIHEAMYENQPRWLSEGIAESLSLSPTETRFNRPGATARISEMIEDGAFTTALSWESGPATGERERNLYTLSHLVIDYLRFGGDYPAPDAMLATLMGMLDRGGSARQLLKDVYGKDAREMDTDIQNWVRGL